MLGNENLLKESSIAIVGSRDSTEYGEQVTKYFTKELVLRDVVIVSGAARGIDYYSHKTCLENSGKTIRRILNMQQVLCLRISVT